MFSVVLAVGVEFVIQVRDKNTRKSITGINVEASVTIANKTEVVFKGQTSKSGTFSLKEGANLKPLDIVSIKLYGSPSYKDQVSKLTFPTTSQGTWIDVTPKGKQLSLTVNMALQPSGACPIATLTLASPKTKQIKQISKDCKFIILAADDEQKLVLGVSYKYMITSPGYVSLSGSYTFAKSPDTLNVILKKV